MCVKHIDFVSYF